MRRIVAVVCLVAGATSGCSSTSPVPLYTGGARPSSARHATPAPSSSGSKVDEGRPATAAEQTRLGKAIDRATDFGTARVEVVITDDGVSTTAAGKERWKGTFAGDFVMTLAGTGGMPIRQLIIGTTSYTQLSGPLARAYPTPWIKITGLDTAHQGKGAVPSFGDPDLAKQLEAGAKAPNLQNLGPETVAGVDATHFRTMIPLPGATLAVFRLAASATPSGDGVVIDTWLTDAGDVFRLVVRGTMGSGRTTMTTVMTDFGVRVDVKAPPSDQVTDITPKK